ncbi:MAG TPA: hypothetical protein VE571_02570 [Solirubrobacteraceae bacterium]|nr:hypothetical protein [Solirubrobacteraceae bacterium]
MRSARLAGQLLERGWIERAANSRAVRIIDAGHAALPDLLGVQTCSPRCAP